MQYDLTDFKALYMTMSINVRVLFSGTAGDSLSGHRGQPFTIKDKDNDSHGRCNCAVTLKRAWWYKRRRTAVFVSYLLIADQGKQVFEREM